MGQVTAIPVPAETLRALAAVVAPLVAAALSNGQTAAEPWLDVAGAAEHLSCGTSRIYSLVSAGRIPHEKDGSRLLFRASELDGWLERGGGKRP
jgi:excisionase family DNA binding protein